MQLTQGKAKRLELENKFIYFQVSFNHLSNQRLLDALHHLLSYTQDVIYDS